MDKVYERAARLVKRTLDVEGAVVMDVSHFAVLESVKAEGSISVVVHNGDPHTNSSHSIPTDEYDRFLEFFTKNPEGKVVEGIMPRCFRSLLPIRVQHALRKCGQLFVMQRVIEHQSCLSSILTNGHLRCYVRITLLVTESHMWVFKCLDGVFAHIFTYSWRVMNFHTCELLVSVA